MNERIKKLRKHLDLTQREFGSRIGIKGNTIANYELGRNEPIDAVISLICREYNVNETWLRTGTGEMFNPSPSSATGCSGRRIPSGSECICRCGEVSESETGISERCH